MESKEPNVSQAVPFFWVDNMQTALDFYLPGLGFELKVKWEPRGYIEWCWLRLGKASIMLQEDRKAAAADPLMPKVEKGAGVSIHFICRDAIALYLEFTSKGLSAKEPFVGNGNWVTAVTDPDGYHLFFESETDAPEEITYVEWLAGK